MNGSAMYAPTLLGHMGFMPSRELGREFHSTLKADVGECDEESFEHGPHVPTMGELSTEFTDEKVHDAKEKCWVHYATCGKKITNACRSVRCCLVIKSFFAIVPWP